MENARLQMQGMEMATRRFGTPDAYEKLDKEMNAFLRAAKDKDYLFDVNPDNVLDEEAYKKGKLRYKDDRPFVMYKRVKGNDKYAYIGKCGLLQDGYKLADNINRVKELYDESPEFMPDLYKHIAKDMCNADKTLNFEDAQKEAKKILNIQA